jgi:hypothetical protein
VSLPARSITTSIPAATARMHPPLEPGAVVRRLPVHVAEPTPPCLDLVMDSLLDDLGRVAVSASTREAAEHFDALLRRVARVLARVVGLTRGAVYLTGDAMTFHGRVGLGGGPALDAQIRAEPLRADTDPVTGELVRTRAPVVVADAHTEACPPASVVRRLDVRELVALPLLIDARVIGAVYLGGSGRRNGCPPCDLERGASLARRAAALVRQGQAVLALRRRVDQARRDREVIERSTRAQLRLDDAAIDGSCPIELTSHAAEVLARPVLLVGPGAELLHVAGDAAVARTLRASWRPGPLGRYLAATSAGPRVLAPLPTFGLTSRLLVCPIDGDGSRSRSLVALEVGRPLDDVDGQVLERAAEVVRLARVVAPRGTSRSTARTAAGFGQRMTATVAEQVGLPAVLVWLDRADERLTEAVLAHVGGPPDARVLLARGEGVGIVARATIAAPLVSGLRRLLSSRGPGAWTGNAVVSRVACTTSAMAGAAAEVEAAASILAQNHVRGRVLALDELGASRLLLAAGASASLARLVADCLPPLAPDAIGPALSTSLIETARTLVATDGSIREAARRLEVHENTVRYRVRRIRDLTGFDLAAVGDLFQFHVALGAWEQLGFELA